MGLAFKETLHICPLYLSTLGIPASYKSYIYPQDLCRYFLTCIAIASHPQVNASSLYYGIGSAPLFLDQVQCNGTESKLAGCRYEKAGVQNCNHLESASVTCKGN